MDTNIPVHCGNNDATARPENHTFLRLAQLLWWFRFEGCLIDNFTDVVNKEFPAHCGNNDASAIPENHTFQIDNTTGRLDFRGI